MQNFEHIRSHVGSRHALRTNDPYQISVELETDDGRRQGVYLAEMEDDAGVPYLRISTPVGPFSASTGERCLRFNWEQRTGFLALSDLAGSPCLQLCENRPYALLASDELDRIIVTLGRLGDRLERALSSGADLF